MMVKLEKARDPKFCRPGASAKHPPMGGASLDRVWWLPRPLSTPFQRHLYEKAVSLLEKLGDAL